MAPMGFPKVKIVYYYQSGTCYILAQCIQAESTFYLKLSFIIKKNVNSEIFFSAKDNESERALREQKIVELTERCNTLRTQRATKELELDRFRSAVTREKEEAYQYRCIGIS